MIYQALERTLRNLLLERWDKHSGDRNDPPDAGEIRSRAEALLARFPDIDAEILPGKSVIGGGATPDQSLERG